MWWVLISVCGMAEQSQGEQGCASNTKKNLLTNARIILNFQHQLRLAVSGSLPCFVLEGLKGASQIRDKMFQ